MEKILVLCLRVLGVSSLFALPFVAAPSSWMNAIHQWLGLGTLPDKPIVEYLTRSLSAFYAMQGGLLLVLSLNPSRYKPVLIYVGLATALFGLALLVIDWTAGLPLMWTVWEGPFVFVFGMVILLLSRRLPNPS